MLRRIFIYLFLIVLVSCQSDQPIGNEILFSDVIGKYDGECAEFLNSTSELMNREEATLTIFAAATNEAGISSTCNRLMDQNIPLLSASAAKIVFERTVNNISFEMTYFAQEDSIVVIKSTDGVAEDLIFTGARS